MSTRESPVRPNFFMVGAAKCATTSLYHYLQQHPNVGLCSPKEPKFFSRKYVRLPQNGPGDDYEPTQRQKPRNLDEYLQIFAPFRGLPVIGEASADNLFYHQTAEDIRAFNPEAKILISLRHPVDRAYSAYTHLVRDGREPRSFREGLALEPTRRAENYSFMWAYREASRYAAQVKHYLDVFGRDRVHVVLQEDISRDTRATMVRVLEFLEVAPRELSTGGVHNRSGTPASPLLHSLVMGRNPIKSVLRRLMPSGMRQRLKMALRNVNLKPSSVDPETRAELMEDFRPDIETVSGLIDRDLSSWLN